MSEGHAGAIARRSAAASTWAGITSAHPDSAAHPEAIAARGAALEAHTVAATYPEHRP